MWKHHLALLALRLVPGAIFLTTGIFKLFLRRAESIDFFATLGFAPAGLFAIGIGVLEVVGGLVLIAGLGTQFFGVLFATEMLVAAIIAELPHGGFMNPGTQLTLTLFAAMLALAGLGGGKYALDQIIARVIRKRKADIPINIPLA